MVGDPEHGPGGLTDRPRRPFGGPGGRNHPIHVVGAVASQGGGHRVLDVRAVDLFGTEQVGGHRQGGGYLARLVPLPVSTEGVEAGDGAQQFGLGSGVGKAAGRVVAVEARFLFSPVSGGGRGGVGMGLQRERPVGGQELDEERKVAVGQWAAVGQGGRCRPVAAEPEFGLGATRRLDAPQGG